jgi:hypothetical protein
MLNPPLPSAGAAGPGPRQDGDQPLNWALK